MPPSFSSGIMAWLKASASSERTSPTLKRRSIRPKRSVSRFPREACSRPRRYSPSRLVRIVFGRADSSPVEKMPSTDGGRKPSAWLS